jgi:hypothetical protein
MRGEEPPTLNRRKLRRPLKKDMGSSGVIFP